MRTLALPILLVVSSPARADECAGDTAPSVDCNALDKHGAMSFSVGWASVPFDPTGHTFKVTNVGFVNQLGQLDGSSLAPIQSNGFFMDVRLHAAPHWYLGVDLGAAWAGPPQPRFVASGEAMTWNSAAVMTMGGVAGVRLPLGRVSVRGELVAGLRAAELGATSPTMQAVRADAIAALLEPRVAVDVWIHRWWVLEAFAGANALDRSERTFGLGLGFHSQAFDGRY